MKPKESIDFNYLAIRPYENLNDKDIAASMERLKQARKTPPTKLKEGIRQAVIAGTSIFGPYILSQMIH